MKILRDVDGDEVSLVQRAANRRRQLLLKGEIGLDDELTDILEVPWEREGALLDEIRKDGIHDENVERAVIAAVRLLKGVESEFSPELIAKVGVELYPHENPKLNNGHGTGASSGELFGSDDGDDDNEGHAAGPSKDGKGRDGELIGSGSAPKVANDNDADDMGKAEFSDSSRKDLADSGKALPDGSYPIRNKSDLGNAIQAFGRAKDKGKAKAWIIRRARALGATGMLPDSWSVSKSDDDSDYEWSEGETTITEGGTVEVQVPVRKEDGTWDLSGVPDESRPFFLEMIEKTDKTESDLKEARELLAKADDTIRHRQMVEKAAAFSHVAPTDELAPILKELSENLQPESFEKLEVLLGAAEERIAKGDLFEEKGRSSLSDGKAADDPWSQIIAKADELVEKSGDPLSQDQAIDRVLKTTEGQDLYARYQAETYHFGAANLGGGVN